MEESTEQPELKREACGHELKNSEVLKADLENLQGAVKSIRNPLR